MMSSSTTRIASNGDGIGKGDGGRSSPCSTMTWRAAACCARAGGGFRTRATHGMAPTQKNGAAAIAGGKPFAVGAAKKLPGAAAPVCQ